MTDRKPWSYVVGRGAHRVRVLELAARAGVLYLRWHVATAAGRKPRYESLGRTLRTSAGKIVRETERWARAEAQRKHEALIRGDSENGATGLGTSPLTIAEAKARITDAKTGRYPTKSAHRRETEKALDFAVLVWGGDRAWNTIRRTDLRQLGRARVDALLAQGAVGYRGAEVTVQRVLTVAQWLRDEELIDEAACVGAKKWKDELRSYLLAATERDELPKPRRLRYTLEEGLRILAAAPAIDPRLDLMLWLAPNQRLGQVVRTRRSHVDLVANELRIPGRGQKRGPVISMTEGERHALDDAFATGYLRLLEAAFLAGEIADYPLFPSGQMPGIRALRRGFGTKAGAPPSWRAPEHPTATVERHAGAKPVVRRTIGEWWALAEARAEVSHLEGRGPYGVRRMFTDESKKRKISREGLTAMGGWSDPQMADRVYADDDARYAREEARDVRASIRGEPASSADNSAIPTGNLQQSSNTALQTEGGV